MDEEQAGASNATSKNAIIKTTNKKITHKLTNTFVRYVIPRPITFWRRFSNNRRQKRISHRIDKELKKDVNNCHFVIVVGDKASGKSTICKQMRILYGNGFSDSEKRKFVRRIEKDIKEAVLYIINLVFSPKKLCDIDSATQTSINNIKNYNFKGDNRDHFYVSLKTVWKNKILQEALEIIEQNRLITAAIYFMNKIEILQSTVYLPTNEDILNCYEPTKAPTEINFESDSFYFKMCEVPNVTPQKRIWKQISTSITIVFLVIPCDDFLKRKNEKLNSLTSTVEELKKFKSRLSSWVTCIIYLNKFDLFQEQILKRCLNLEDCFPGISLDKNLDPSKILTAVKEFITNTIFKGLMGDDEWCNWYIHFTCATDSEFMNDVFRECTNLIRSLYTCSCPLY